MAAKIIILSEYMIISSNCLNSYVTYNSLYLHDKVELKLDFNDVTR